MLVGEGIVDHPSWKHAGAKCIARDAKALADAVAPLLRCCAQVVFVDPYFSCLKRTHLDSFLGFVVALRSRVGLAYPGRIEVVTALAGYNPPTWRDFKGACEDKILPHLPAGWRVRFVVVNDIGSRGEKLHNRYILTDLGGIVFGVGLDSGSAKEADDLSVMSREQYEKRWEQYAGPSPEFSVEGTNELILTGAANVVRTQSRPSPSRGGRR